MMLLVLFREGSFRLSTALRMLAKGERLGDTQKMLWTR